MPSWLFLSDDGGCPLPLEQMGKSMVKIGCNIGGLAQDGNQAVILMMAFSHILVEKSLQECYIKRSCDGLAGHTLSFRDSNDSRVMRGGRQAKRHRKSRLQGRRGLHDGTG